MRNNRLTVGIGLGRLRWLTVLAIAAVLGLLVVPGAFAATPHHFHKTSPANGAVGQSPTPTLKWSVSTHAKSYRYCVDRTNNNRCGTKWVSTHSKRSAGLTALKRGATYYWQVKAVNAHGSATANGGKWFTFTVSHAKAAVPQSGHWTISLPTTQGGGAPGTIYITGAEFTVASNHSAVTSFGFSYTYDGPGSPPGASCSGAGGSAESASSPITNDQFSTPGETGWTGAGSATFQGTFTSATHVRGTASFQVYIGGSGCAFKGSVNTGTVSWTATAG